MDGLEAEAYDRSYSDRALIARIIGYFRPKLPILIAKSIDTLVASKTLSSAGMLIALILVTGVLSWTCNFFRQRYTARSVGDVVLNLREDAFASVTARDMSFYDEFPSGKIVSRVTSDTEEFATVVTLTLNLLSQFLLFFLVAGVLFVVNLRLALLAMTIMPFIILIALVFRRIARSITQKAQRSMARVNANVQEVVSGITVAKNFRQEQNMYNEFKKVNEQSYQVNVRSGFIYNGVFPLLVLVANIGTVIVVSFGGLNVLDKSITAGDWFLFLQGIRLLWFPLTSIASFWSQFQLGLAASERVFALIDAEPRIHQLDRQPVTRLAGEIEFRDMFFSYDDRQTVLADFNLKIE